MNTQIINFFTELGGFIYTGLLHNGIYLVISILIAVALTVYIDANKLRRLFLKRSGYLIPASVTFGAFTPLCACGTMAVVLSLLTTTLPWGPIMAFLVSSPLMSPDTFVLVSGFMGFEFAAVLTVASVIIGLAAGYLTYFIEKKTVFLSGQLKQSVQKKENSDSKIMQPRIKPDIATLKVNFTVGKNQQTACCTASVKQSFTQTMYEKLKINEFLLNVYKIGFVKIIPLFLLFSIFAFVVKNYVPTEWIVMLFSGNNFFSVPIAAIIGLPVYVSDASVIPLIQVLKEAGASSGSLLAFMISGPGTSVAVIGGLSLIMKKKALLLYTAYIFFGAIVLGYLYDFVLHIL